MEFKQIFNGFIKQGYRSAFIRDKIAKHCGVSSWTVQGWINGKPVRDTYFIMLKGFEL